MSIIEGANAVSEAGTTKTTGSKHGNYLDKHCFAGTCNGKKFSGSSMSKHAKSHKEKNEEGVSKTCIGEECEDCDAYQSSKGKSTSNLSYQV